MQLHVLLADSDEVLLGGYWVHLSGQGIGVSTVTNGLECLAALRAAAPDVLVIDSELRWGSGLGVLALMRENDTPTVPVLLLTSSLEQTAAQLPIGPCACMDKPVPPATLAGVVQALARSRCWRRCC